MVATREGKSRFTYTNKIADGSPMTLDSTNSSEQLWEQKQFTGYECRLHQYLLYIHYSTPLELNYSPLVYMGNSQGRFNETRLLVYTAVHTLIR